MRRKERKMTDQAVINLIEKQNVLRLGLSVDNKPYVVPLNYGFKDNAFYIHCAREGRKLDMIRKNPLVCVEIEGENTIVEGDIACKYTTKYSSVIGYGHAEILESLEEIKDGLDILMAQFSDRQFTYGQKVMEKIAIIKIQMDELSGKSS
ncbi:pyridoxamine 5'-phosphate oxidase family protein [Acidaminobacter sp. JC074]|uniref:pyridoxamine 5'-phosphate oxidase family protein n=1 Tax=Acidaminobacter sp. JC074 TaxID=2530199 RepID=UPI001F0EBF09|nr:pyridoxamine 5'-phosphate oxidase family protein [Acidaminobacter sp. JC074]MCH4890548.1 pyridoxamine 5'-phosphate oxidase family protein [Acidaminobacter sp. JC074]